MADPRKGTGTDAGPDTGTGPDVGTGTGPDVGTGTGTDVGTGTGTDVGTDNDAGLAAARERLALAQAGLLNALVADAPVPPGFDHRRLAVQRRALVTKRADVVAKVAPELPRILGPRDFRTAFTGYAGGRPMTGNHRQDALDFAAHLLDGGRPEDRRARRELRVWWEERSGPAPGAARTGRLRALLRRAAGPR